MRRILLTILILLLLAAGLAYLLAGRGAPPGIAIDRPERLIGLNGTLEVTVTAPESQLQSLQIALHQGETVTPLFSLDAPGDAAVTQVDADRMRVTRPIGKAAVSTLQAGSARIVVNASRQSFLNLRTLESSASKDVEVRLEPPRLAVTSTYHYINHGGSEFVVFRLSPADAVAVVRVGDVDYPTFAAADAGIASSPDTGLRVGFFALLHHQDLNTPIALLARDDAGNEASLSFVDRRFPQPIRRSRIQLDDRFLSRVVPEILQRSPELGLSAPSGDLVPAFLRVNRELRQINADQIRAATASTSPTKLWDQPFAQLSNSKVEASFADHRTYFYNGDEVDQQVHLGFDLAVTAAVPVTAANTGRVVHAGWLGIYGNTVIVDHGLAVATLYAHLSTVDVKVGETVERGQPVGRSGMTGLAGGDHLHFTVLLHGEPVNPVEWWDPLWTRDRVERKLREAGGGAAPSTR
jgi:murein DD-endopeptidase MepM/ murein hydrolase activator NlpD